MDETHDRRVTGAGVGPLTAHQTAHQRAILWLPSGAQMCDTVLLRRITGLRGDDLHTDLHTELRALEHTGLIERCEPAGFLRKLLLSKPGESYYALTTLGKEHSHINCTPGPRPARATRPSRGEAPS